MTNYKDGRYTNGTRTTLRLPADLKQKIVELLPPGMSQNDYIIKAIREKIAQQRSNKMQNPKQKLIEEVTKLVKTDPAPYNETTLEDYILEGDTDDMTAQQIADEWDEVNSREREG